MIRRLIRRVFKSGPASSPVAGGPSKIPYKEHGIARNDLSPCALKTVTTLQQQGYAAFIVGGAVRDLAIGRHPKDYDVATSATPEEVRAVFRRSRIIGRRFRLVHVMCGDETIEVSTFRGSAVAGAEEDEDDQLTRTSENGRILRDNVFGTQEQDAVRRDFTANALYYDPTTQEIWDYQGGYADVRAKVLRMIGDPEQRYREDPVRMLRAARLAAKLDFHIDPATREPVARLADLLQDVPSARLFDEITKLLLSGHALRGVHQLRAEGLHHGLLPMLDVILEQPLGERFITLAMKNTDARIAEDKPVSLGFLLAALLWHEVLMAWQKFESQGMKPIAALHEAMDEVLHIQDQQLSIPRRFDAIMKELWSMQPRFQYRAGQRPYRLLEHPRFRGGFDFLMLRCASGEADAELGQWWQTFQYAGADERERMLQPDTAPKKKRRRKRRNEGGGEVVQHSEPSAE
jgi:poly(A) polymerase